MLISSPQEISSFAKREIELSMIILAVSALGYLGLGTPTKSAQGYIEAVEDTWEELHSIEPMPRPVWRR